MGELYVKIAGCYLRVSSDKQTAENQRADVEQLAMARRYDCRWYEEQESAVKKRPELERLMEHARRGQLGAIIVWRLDRLQRSMVGAIQTVLELDRLGVPVISAREAWLDTASPARPLLVAVFGWVAEQEREVLIERTKAGLARARAQGVRLGRPPASLFDLGAAICRVRAGASVRGAARSSGVRESTLRRHLAAQRGERPAGQP